MYKKIREKFNNLKYEDRLKIVNGWRECGLTDKAIAKQLHISIDTLEKIYPQGKAN